MARVSLRHAGSSPTRSSKRCTRCCSARASSSRNRAGTWRAGGCATGGTRDAWTATVGVCARLPLRAPSTATASPLHCEPPCVMPPPLRAPLFSPRTALRSGQKWCEVFALTPILLHTITIAAVRGRSHWGGAWIVPACRPVDTQPPGHHKPTAHTHIQRERERERTHAHTPAHRDTHTPRALATTTCRGLAAGLAWRISLALSSR